MMSEILLCLVWPCWCSHLLSLWVHLCSSHGVWECGSGIHVAFVNILKIIHCISCIKNSTLTTGTSICLLYKYMFYIYRFVMSVLSFLNNKTLILHLL